MLRELHNTSQLLYIKPLQADSRLSLTPKSPPYCQLAERMVIFKFTDASAASLLQILWTSL